MKEFILLSIKELIALSNNEPVEIRIDEKPFTLCSDECYENQIAEISVTDAAERKKGKWIRTKSGFLCSECKSGIKNQPLLMGRPMFCYCPFCGVKVEGCE